MNISKKTAEPLVAEKSKNDIIDPAIDMTELYFKIGTSPMFLSKKCPTIFSGMYIPDKCDYLTILYDNKPVLVYTRRGLTDKDIIRIVTGDTKDYSGVITSCPKELERFCVADYVTKCNISSFYRLGAILAKSLNIPCPQIIILNELSENAKTGRGNTVYNEKRIITHIEIYEKNDFNEIDMFEALAHEMRHCWQIENHYDKYFSTFQDLTAFAQNCREQYHLQLAEIDAIAYALRFIRACTGEDYDANTIYPTVNREIELYAKTLDDSLFAPFEGLLQ